MVGSAADGLVGDGVGVVDELLHIAVANHLGDHGVDEVEEVLVALLNSDTLAVGIVGNLAEDGQIIGLGLDRKSVV